jgi:hypothetical protein
MSANCASASVGRYPDRGGGEDCWRASSYALRYKNQLSPKWKNPFIIGERIMRLVDLLKANCSLLSILLVDGTIRMVSEGCSLISFANGIMVGRYGDV